MEKMLEDGSLKTGTACYEFSDDEIPQEKLEQFAAGNRQLSEDFGVARDAFSQDHADVFYLDYDYLSIRVTNCNNTYKITLGIGRGDSYLNKQFSSTSEVDLAISTVNAKVNEIVKKVTSEEFKASIDERQDLEEQQIKYVHNEIIKNCVYKLEPDISNEKYAYSVRNVYGVFGNGEAVCEGFSRAFKMVLDKLNIPCVLVTGVYMHNTDTPEEHMWTYVQLQNGKWYGVDPTFDNTDDQKGEISTQYLLVGIGLENNQ